MSNFHIRVNNTLDYSPLTIQERRRGLAAKVGEIREVPGPLAQRVIGDDKRFGATTTQDYGFIPSKGKGALMVDADGNEYLDFTCGAGVNNLGHNHSRVGEAVLAQLALGLTQYDANVWPNPASVELKKRLAGLATERFGGNFKVFLSNSGAEANEAAIKLLFHSRPTRTAMIAFENAFHGRTLGCLPLMAGKEVHHRGVPKAYRVFHFPYPYCWRCAYGQEENYCDFPCIKFIEDRFGTVIAPSEINAVFLEIPQGEGGVNVPDPGAIRELAALCRKYGILIVVDEVQSGMGRTGTLFACEQYGIKPDIITVAKALSNGVAPLGATIFRTELDFKEKGVHSNTNGGNALACAAALAVLDTVADKNFLDLVAFKGRYLQEQLEKLINRFGRKFLVHVKGMGLMVGIEVVNDSLRDAIEKECLRRGLVLASAGNPKKNPVLRMLPPLVITIKEIDQAIAILEESIKEALKVP